MEAAKKLHDAMCEASMARRLDSAGWILLHPGGAVPDTHTALLSAKVLPLHVGLVSAVKALRTAAKNNWTQGRRAWGPGSIKLQLVKQGDPGHKGQRDLIWVNVATRGSTATERRLKKNSTLLQLTKFPIPVVDALEVYEATNRVLNRPADACNYRRVLSPGQQASDELDSGHPARNKHKPDWIQDSTPVRPVVPRRRVPAAAPQAPQKKKAKLQHTAAELAEPSKLEAMMPITFAVADARQRNRSKTIDDFKSSSRKSAAAKEFSQVIEEQVRAVYGANEGDTNQMAAGIALAARTLKVGDKVHTILAHKGRPSNLGPAELLEGQFDMGLSATQTKQLGGFLRRHTNSSVPAYATMVAEKRKMVAARCPAVQKYPQGSGMSQDSRFVQAAEFAVKAMESPELQPVLDLNVSAAGTVVLMISCDGANAARNRQNELCVASLLNDALYSNSVHSGVPLSAGDAKENALTVAAIMSNTLGGLELGEDGALPTIEYRCTKDEDKGRRCATCEDSEAKKADEFAPTVSRKRRAKPVGHRPDARPPAEGADMHKKDVDLRIVVDGACMTYMANVKQGSCPHCLEAVTNATNANNHGISYEEAKAKLVPMERYERANDAYRAAEESHRQRLGANSKKPFEGSTEHKQWGEEYHRHKGPSLLPKYVRTALQFAPDPLHCASAVVSKALEVSVLSHVVAQELANQHRAGFGPGWFLALWCNALRDPAVNLPRLASGYEAAYKEVQAMKVKVPAPKRTDDTAESMRGQARQLDRASGGKLTLRAVQVSSPHQLVKRGSPIARCAADRPPGQPPLRLFVCGGAGNVTTRAVRRGTRAPRLQVGKTPPFGPFWRVVGAGWCARYAMPGMLRSRVVGSDMRKPWRGGWLKTERGPGGKGAFIVTSSFLCVYSSPHRGSSLTTSTSRRRGGTRRRS